MFTDQDTWNPNIMLPKLKNNNHRCPKYKSHRIKLKIGTGIKIMVGKSKMTDPKTENNGKMVIDP